MDQFIKNSIDARYNAFTNYYEITDNPEVKDIVITVYKLRKDGVEEKTKYKGNEEIKKLLENKMEIEYPDDYFE